MPTERRSRMDSVADAFGPRLTAAGAPAARTRDIRDIQSRESEEPAA